MEDEKHIISFYIIFLQKLTLGWEGQRILNYPKQPEKGVYQLGILPKVPSSTYLNNMKNIKAQMLRLLCLDFHSMFKYTMPVASALMHPVYGQ